MIYDVQVVVKGKSEKETQDIHYLANASNASHLNLLLDKHLPKGAEVTHLIINTDFEEVIVLNPKGANLYNVTCSNIDKPSEECSNCPHSEDCPDLKPLVSHTFCIANSINEVLQKIAELDFDGELLEIELWTEDVTYIH
jgi:hypothetical protein